MARDFTAVLQQAMEFYVAGQIVEARALLLDVVRADSKIEAGWMFLSYTLDEPKQKADCYRKVLALNPNNAEARAALEKLEANLNIGPQPPRRTAELLHETPFTVDIDHATDDLSAAGKASGTAAEPIPPAQATPVKKTPTAHPTTAPLTPSAQAATPKPMEQPPSAGPANAPAQPLKTHADPPPVASTPVKAAEPFGQEPSPTSAQPAEQAPIPVPPFLADSSEPAAPPPAKAGQTASAGAAAVKQTVKGKPAAELPHKPIPAKPASKPPVVQEQDQPKKKGNRGCTCLIAAVVLVLIAAGIGVGLWLAGYIPETLLSGFLPAQGTPLAEAATHTPVPLITLPPEWTLTPTPTITKTSTITLTPTMTLIPTPTLTPTFMPPDATIQAEMEKVKKQVEDLRGLKLKDPLPVYIVTTVQAEGIMQAEVDRLGYRQTIGNTEQAYVALGFIKPSFNLSFYAFYHLAEGTLGFYLPVQKSIFVIGNRFAGIEKSTFSHEVDHALIFHYFPAVGIIDGDPACETDLQRCDAIRALVEGDAVLINGQWFAKYASDSEKAEIVDYQIPFTLPAPYNSPPYAGPAWDFVYEKGFSFVDYFYKKGKWPRVSKLYDTLPVSTEQILHPEKYEWGEKPVTMRIPDLKAALGESWSLIKSDSLGEYMTYLLLAYGADASAQISTDKALAASAGWGGDRYLVFASSQGNQVLLSAEWTWDSDKDATDFLARMKEYLDLRFHGGKAEASAGDCWKMNEETTCVFRKGRNILWILGPNLDLIGSVRSAYGNY